MPASLAYHGYEGVAFRDDEKPRLWKIVTEQWPNYDVYQTRTDRVIPLVVLFGSYRSSPAAMSGQAWACTGARAGPRPWPPSPSTPRWVRAWRWR